MDIAELLARRHDIWNTNARTSRLTEFFSPQERHSERYDRVAQYPILFGARSVPQGLRTRPPAEPISFDRPPQPQCSAPEPRWMRSEPS